MTQTRPKNIRSLPALVFMAGLLALLTFGPARGSAAEDAAVEDVQTADPGLGQTFESSEPYVPDQVLIQPRGKAAAKTVDVPEGADPEKIARKLQARPGVRAASPNFIARASAWTPNDPGVQPWRSGPPGGWQRRQWNFLPCLSLCGEPGPAGQKQSRGGIDVLDAWRNLRRAHRAGAAGVRVAVIDSGVAYRNYKKRFRKSPDLKRRHIGNGYDFVGHDRLPLDRYGHGTHVTSTISAATNNGKGTTGMAYKAKILPVRVLNANGFGTTKSITDGVRWAANHHAKVAVMSLNFPCGQRSKVLSNALAYAHRRGVILVASAGNKGATGCVSLPATAPGVISVGASTPGGCLADYSFRSAKVTLTAPGGGRGYVDCPYSNRNRPILQLSMRYKRPTKFAIQKRWEGTSMAAAHVAGAAAMIVASKVLSDGTGPRQVRRRLISTARLPGYAGTQPDSGFGAGIIDVGKATDPDVP